MPRRVVLLANVNADQWLRSYHVQMRIGSGCVLRSYHIDTLAQHVLHEPVTL